MILRKLMAQHDVLLVGGGGAGLRAAIAIAEADPDLSVAVVSKVYPMRSHTVAAEGGAAGVVKDEDSLDDHCYDTISGGDWLTDQDAVEYFVNEAPRELTQLEHWGCPWSRQDNGKIAVRPFGGMKIERTWYAADKTGFHMLHTLFQTSLKYKAVKRYDEWFVTKLLVDQGRCCGVAALEIETGKVEAITAKAVILCTGGAGRMYSFTTNANIKTGDGMALAYRAGVALKDMEFVQFHPTGLPGTGILITEASRGEGGVLLNKDGYRYLQDYDLGKPMPHPVKRSMELGPRDRLSQAFVAEEKAGRTLTGEFGSYVHLDIRHLGKKRIMEKLPMVRELCVKYVGIDPVTDYIPVRPVIHYCMGGVHTDIDARTSLDGLFAAGECACVSINGANRLGSNSLVEILVFGARAGHNAVAFAKECGEPDHAAIAAQIEDEKNRIDALQNGTGDRIATLRNELQSSMEDGAGIYRDESGLSATAAKVAELKDRYKNVHLDDASKVYNTEVISALELEYLLDCAEALVHSALARTESRGSHQRTDHTERDDDNFLQHSLAYYRPGEPPQTALHPVIVTRWPPGKRVYGQ
ncbi:MAG: fumarate reductase (quinol) flavoprotein subunit [Planctomycetota bacterium]